MRFLQSDRILLHDRLRKSRRVLTDICGKDLASILPSHRQKTGLISRFSFVHKCFVFTGAENFSVAYSDRLVELP
jgi:hypothetical protein